MSDKRITVRVVARDAKSVVAVIEQRIPATHHDVHLFLRRAPASGMVAEALLTGRTITIEERQDER